MKAVIMCGGSGTRLWPISRESSPKQFVPLFGNQSLFQLTIERNKNICDGFIVVVNEKQLQLCKSQIPSDILNRVEFIVESVARNTAPAITLAALSVKNEPLLILASDHLIKNQKQYEQCVLKALNIAQYNSLVTFGIYPQYPETGYGYIQADGEDVKSFKEKPDYETAQKYISEGNYFWNSGMFIFQSNVYLEELEKHDREIYHQSKIAFEKSKKIESTYFIDIDHMKNIPANSIDYAVMEKSSNVKVVKADFGWSDLGSFDSIYSELDADECENVSKNEYVQINASRNLILSEKLVALFDVNDLIIVDTKDALLIGKREESQTVKKVFEKIKEIKPNLLD